MPFKRVMPLVRGVTQSRWDYVNVRGFETLPVALAVGSRAFMALGGGGGLTSTASWRLWSKLSERNNRLLAVTFFPYMREARRGTAASL